MPFLTVKCEVCNKPVSQMTTSFDRDHDSYLVVANCHSKFDRVRLPSTLMDGSWAVSELRAFRVSKELDRDKIVEGSFTTVKPVFPLLGTSSNEPAELKEVVDEVWSTAEKASYVNCSL